MIGRHHTDRSSLVVVGHGFCGTGFSRVLQGLLPLLAKKYDVHHVGLNCWPKARPPLDTSPKSTAD